jgi:hypothetical protein
MCLYGSYHDMETRLLEGLNHDNGHYFPKERESIDKRLSLFTLLTRVIDNYI